MPRKCLACSSSERQSIDKALVEGEPLRNIAKRVSISPAGLLRHKNHLSRTLVKAAERCEEHLGDNLLGEMRRVQHKAWDLLAKTESDGDHRASIVALREVRECLAESTVTRGRPSLLPFALRSEATPLGKIGRAHSLICLKAMRFHRVIVPHREVGQARCYKTRKPP
jgi:hypothetical protein